MLNGLVEPCDISYRDEIGIPKKRRLLEFPPSLWNSDTARPQDHFVAEQCSVNPGAEDLYDAVVHDTIGKSQERCWARSVSRLRNEYDFCSRRFIASALDSGLKALRESLAHLPQNRIFEPRRKQVIALGAPPHGSVEVQFVHEFYEGVFHRRPNFVFGRRISPYGVFRKQWRML